MAQNKTVETSASVADYVKTLADKQQRDDSLAIIEMMRSASGFEPKMWGPAIIGFGTYHYSYESGREGDMPILAFAPRKGDLVFYFDLNKSNREDLLPKLGKHKTSKYCIYVKKLSDIDSSVLNKMIKVSLRNSEEKQRLGIKDVSHNSSTRKH